MIIIFWPLGVGLECSSIMIVSFFCYAIQLNLALITHHILISFTVTATDIVDWLHVAARTRD